MSIFKLHHHHQSTIIQIFFNFTFHKQQIDYLQFIIQDIMLEDKLPELIRSTYNIKILVSASYKAKETLAVKGLTPAIFLDRFYRSKSNRGPLEVSYFFSQKYTRALPQFTTIDQAEYDFVRRQGGDQIQDIDEPGICKRLAHELQGQKLKYQREVDRNVFANKLEIQNFLNNQSYHWFDKTNKAFYNAVNMGQNSFTSGFIDQPYGVTYVIEVQNDKTCNEVFDKVKLDAEMLLKKLYQLNSDQYKHVRPFVLLLVDQSQGTKYQECSSYMDVLKNQYGIHSSHIYRLGINGDQLHDSVQWSRFNRPILHYQYKLKASDPVRLIPYQKIAECQEKMVDYHKQTIRKAFQDRLAELCRKHQQVNRTTKKIANFFRGNAPTQRHFTREEADMRQLADRMFLLQDYKRAYDIYKNIAGKMSGRNSFLENTLSQMIQICLSMSKFLSIKIRSDPYSEIQKYAHKILSFYSNKSRLRHKKYLVFLLLSIHSFKAFNKQFIKQVFHNNLKSSFSQSQQAFINIVPLLLYEQYANINLFYPKIDYRRYCFDLTRVASRFSDQKLYNYALRCLLIVEGLYRESFANIEKYQMIQLSHLFSQIKNYRESLRYLKQAWVIYANRIQSQESPKDDGQLLKLTDNFLKIMKIIEKDAPGQLKQLISELIYPNLQIPIVQSLNLQIADEMLESDEKSGIKWKMIGEAFLENKELMSQGFNQKQFSRLFACFDTGIAEQKYLIHRFKPPGMLNTAIIEKNSRTAYVNQPIKISFYFRNPLRSQISIQNIILKFKNSYQSFEQPAPQKCLIQAFKSEKVSFFITPKSQGFLELEAIYWNFMKLLTQHRIKEPVQLKNPQKSAYFKLNILGEVGRLQAKSNFNDHYHEGQKGMMSLCLTNKGCKKINQVYIAVGQQSMYGFRLKPLDVQLNPNQEKNISLNINIPMISHNIQSGEQKKICKILFLYETNDKFRVARTINKFNIVRVAKIQKLLCERLSTHLHLLSFTKKMQQTRGEPVLLEWMVLPKGFQIVKMEAAHLSNQTNYFFFLRKGKFGISTFYFSNNPYDAKKYPEQFLYDLEEDPQSNMKLKFLWRRNLDHFGCICPPKMPITINAQGYLSTQFPINFKINYEKQIQHNFSQQSFLIVPFSIKLKNILEKEELKVTIYFMDGKDSDRSWQGITERKLTLSGEEEVKISINYILIKGGIIDISKEIKYIIENSKGQHMSVAHFEYESIYLCVKDTGNSAVESIAGVKRLDAPDFEDAFKDFEVIRQEPKKMEENESLI